MRRLFHVVMALASLAARAPAADEAKPLKVLFLGDRGHHVPAERADQLIPVLATRGIDVAYTEKLADLNPSNLARFDALLFYANIDRIEPDQEKALLDYVAGGGGYVPVHCASYCFRNSDACVNLLGALFEKHGMGRFDTEVVAPDHPIMKGLVPFHTTDETYVHTRHNEADRQVLQVRVEGGLREPWTWVRTHGKGRVFYTAYGHDATTWGHPGFHDLIERGIRWAARKGEVFDSRPRVAAGLKPLEIIPAPSPIPNYVASAKWGVQGAPIATMQKPISAAESRKHLALPKGFEARLFAAEPDIARPICMAWDHRGRLWIAESVDYPNEKQPQGQGRDRIKICEDTNADGVADRFTVFADKLSIPTSLLFSQGGVIVHQAPDTLFLKDNDGDDKADEKRVLFTGWGTQDTHAGPSNLRWGLDNWVYGIVGYSAFNGTVGGERLDFKQGPYRFKPDGSKLEFLRSTNNNSWGVGISEEGLLFGSTANGCPSVYMAIPNRYYESVRGWSPSVLANIADSNRFFPITDKVRQVDWHGGFTAAAGHALYTARTYPREYWNRTAFVAEPTGHLLATFTLHPRGSDFVSHNAWNLVAGDDEWIAPITGEVGPDGNVWTIDWYNFIVQHNPTPQGFKTGKGNAYETPLRDRTHGRIYRIVAVGGKPSDATPLDPNDPKQLVTALRRDNQFWRLHAQRLLVERGRLDVVPALVDLLRDQSVDAIGLNTAAIHALWTLHGLKALEPGARPGDLTTPAAVLVSTRHPSAGVRRNAALVLAGTKLGARNIDLLDDPDAQVRLAALLSLSDASESRTIAAALVKQLQSGGLETDRWLADAATSAAARHALPFLRAIAAASFAQPPGAKALEIVGRVAEHLARGKPGAAVTPLLADLKSANPAIAETLVAGLSRGWPRNASVTLADADEKALAALMTSLPPRARGSLITLANRMGSKALERNTEEIARTFLDIAANTNAAEAERLDAARQVIALRRSDPEAARKIIELITPRTAPALAAGWLDALALSEAPGLAATLVERLPGLTPAVRPVVLRLLMSRPDWTATLMDAFERGAVPLSALALDQKQALAAHPNAAIAERARALLAKGGGLPDPDRQKVIEDLAPKVLRAADAERGKIVFKDQCSKCHTHNGEGGNVGPDLTGVAVHPKEELLVHVLDPSRSVEGNFVQYTVMTTDGRVLNGLLAAESKTSIELVDSEAKRHTLQRDDVEELVASKKSVMPEGFEKQVSTDDLANLLAFLTRRGKYLPLDLRPVATIVSTLGMFYSKDAAAERLIFNDWTPKTFEGVPFLLVDPHGDRVPNVVLLNSRNGTIPPTMPKSVSLPVNAPAKAIHLLSGVSGWGYNGSPVSPTVSMIVRVHYEDGTTEDHPLKNGVHFADYIRVVDVPGSKLAFRLRGQQVRYLAITPKRPDSIRTIEFVKGPDATAPIVMAATVEARD